MSFTSVMKTHLQYVSSYTHRAYLESLSMYLYDALRPLILRESSIDILSDLCLTIHASMTADNSLHSTNTSREDKGQAGSDENDVTSALDTNEDDQANEHAKEIHGNGLAFVTSSVRLVLEDTQQRLAFRAQTFIRQEIEGFKPRDEEILLFSRGRGR